MGNDPYEAARRMMEAQQAVQKTAFEQEYEKFRRLESTFPLYEATFRQTIIDNLTSDEPTTNQLLLLEEEALKSCN